MPWEHCGAPLLDDADVCPACGVTKAQWTVGFVVTRTFRVGPGRGVLRLRLVQGEDEPVSGEVVRVAQVVGGGVAEVTTDEAGAASVPTTGPCRVTFPGRAAGAFARVAQGPPADEAGFECAPGRRHEFRLAAAGVIHAQVFARRSHTPLARRPFVLRTSPEDRLGHTTAEGIVRCEGLPVGYHELEVDGWHGLVDAVPAALAATPSHVHLTRGTPPPLPAAQGEGDA